jgi:transposase
MPQLNSNKKAVIMALVGENVSFSEIARRIECSHSTVVRLVEKFQSTGSTDGTKGSGHPELPTTLAKRLLYRMSLRDRFKNAVNLTEKLASNYGINISPRTTRRTLEKLGLHGRRSIEKLRISRINKINRLRWAESHQNWTQDNWDRLIFSDECKFNLDGSDGRLYVRRKVGERMSPSCQQLTHSRKPGVMVWGCFSSRGLGRICVVETTLNGEQYRRVLQENLIPSFQDMFADNGDVMLQQDNAPCHKQDE